MKRLLTMFLLVGLLTSVAGQTVLRRIKRTGCPVVRVGYDAFRSISALPKASGIGLIIRQPWGSLEPVSDRSVWICVERIRSPCPRCSACRARCSCGSRHERPAHPACARGTGCGVPLPSPIERTLPRVRCSRFRAVRPGSNTPRPRPFHRARSRDGPCRPRAGAKPRRAESVRSARRESSRAPRNRPAS